MVFKLFGNFVGHLEREKHFVFLKKLSRDVQDCLNHIIFYFCFLFWLLSGPLVRPPLNGWIPLLCAQSQEIEFSKRQRLLLSIFFGIDVFQRSPLPLFLCLSWYIFSLFLIIKNMSLDNDHIIYHVLTSRCHFCHHLVFSYTNIFCMISSCLIDNNLLFPPQISFCDCSLIIILSNPQSKKIILSNPQLEVPHLELYYQHTKQAIEA